MKLLLWNIRHGGGARSNQIVGAITSHDPDIIALTEFRTKPGQVICQLLESKGWGHVQRTGPIDAENGICVLSRRLIQRRSPASPFSEHAVRWLDIDVLEENFSLSVVHIPSSGTRVNCGEKRGAVKVRFWNALLEAATARAHERLLLVGDFNTGLHGIDEVGSRFRCAEDFARLTAIGWTDVWRSFHGRAKEYTWFSSGRGGRAGNGFRLDHAFATQSLVPSISACRYSHAEREQKISDHSLLILEIK